MARSYQDPIASLLTPAARRDLRFLTRLANNGLEPGERISQVEYLKDAFETVLVTMAQRARQSLAIVR